MRTHFLTLLAAALVLGGCASSIVVPTTHVAMFSGAGNLVDPTGNVGCQNGKTPPCNGKHYPLRPYKELSLTDAAKYRQALLEDLVANAPRDPQTHKRQVLLYVHGGMNTQRGTVQHAAGLVPYIPAGVTYPIFINWQSSLFTTYADH